MERLSRVQLRRLYRGRSFGFNLNFQEWLAVYDSTVARLQAEHEEEALWNA